VEPMTPECWRASEEPLPLVDWLVARRATQRKLRLYALAVGQCIYTGDPASREDSFRRALRVTRQNVDTPSWRPSGRSEYWLLAVDAGNAARRAAVSPDLAHDPLNLELRRAAVRSAREVFGDPFAARTLYCVKCGAAETAPGGAAFEAPWSDGTFCSAGTPAGVCQGRALSLLPPGRRTPALLALAARAYNERKWPLLPVLADLLEELGCADADALAHLRGPGPHALGCWALDLVLGRR
jgi:hypothetical protein